VNSMLVLLGRCVHLNECVESAGLTLTCCIRETRYSNVGRLAGCCDILSGNLHSVQANSGVDLRVGLNSLLPNLYLLVSRDCLSVST
jgi:hypothetical protein